MAMQVELLNASKTLLSGEVDEIVAPSVNGEVDILTLHTDYVTVLGPGNLRLRQGSQTTDYPISAGLLLTKGGNKATILIDSVL